MSPPRAASLEPSPSRSVHRRATPAPASAGPQVRLGPVVDVLVWPSRGRAATRQRLAEDGRLIDLAIAAQLDYREELCERVVARRPLEVSTVGNDRHCALGAWLHGAGGRRFGNHPDFEEAVAWHRRFHAAAAVVAVHASEGRWDMATALLYAPSLESTSAKVVAALKRLKPALRAMLAPP